MNVMFELNHKILIGLLCGYSAFHGCTIVVVKSETPPTLAQWFFYAKAKIISGAYNHKLAFYDYQRNDYIYRM